MLDLSIGCTYVMLTVFEFLLLIYQEVLRLRTHLIREKQCREELKDQLDKIQGIRRFDPCKAFQHSTKENIAPKTPFKEGK